MSESTISLSKLVPWSGNVRKTGATDSIGELMASIAAHGLLQSLVVRKTSRGKFAVVAGERRRTALTRLAETGQIEANYPVPCRVISGEADPTEISLAENVVRQPMHPADQFEAFSGLAQTGASLCDVAARFGVSEAIVIRRMKLGRVAPSLLDLYRQGEMSLEQVQAFTINDDHAEQQRVWGEITAGYGGRSPQLIRHMLTQGEIPATDKRVRLVTLEAYEAAGGGVRRDLFDERTGGYVLDPALLDQLVQAELSAVAAAVTAEGWLWCATRLELDWQERSRYQQLHPEAVELAAEEREQFDRLTAHAEKLAFDDEEGVLVESEQEDLAEIEARLAVLAGHMEAYSDEQRSRAGAIVTIRGDGTIGIERGLVRPEDVRATNADPDGRAASKQPGGLSAALTDELTQHRTAILQAELAANPDVALAAVVHAMIPRVFGIYGIESCLDIHLAFPALSNIVDGSNRGATALDAERECRSGQLPDDAGDLWAWCLARPREQLLDLLALCVAPALNAVKHKSDTPSSRRLRHADELASSLGINMAAWFRPTADNYFGRVAKQTILDNLAEARQAPNPASWTKLTKAGLAVIAEQHIGPTWLPEPLRIATPETVQREVSADLDVAAA